MEVTRQPALSNWVAQVCASTCVDTLYTNPITASLDTTADETPAQGRITVQGKRVKPASLNPAQPGILLEPLWRDRRHRRYGPYGFFRHGY